jgi:hypothetical protein
MFERDTDEQLFMRLRRIAVAAGSLTKAGDRRRILTMESELSSVRAAITARCEKLAAEMRASRAQLGAIAAYSRCASLTRGASKLPTSVKTTGT